VWRSRTGIVEFEDLLGCRRLVGIDAGWDRRLLGIKDSFGLKICWDQSLVGIEDLGWMINDSLGSKTILNRRLVGIETGVEIEDWDR
jgi:hypothetical protein